MFLTTYVSTNGEPFDSANRQHIKSLLYGYNGLPRRVIDGKTQWIYRVVGTHKIKVLSNVPLKVGSSLSELSCKEVSIDDSVSFECHAVIKHIHKETGKFHFTKDNTIINGKIENWLLKSGENIAAMPVKLAYCSGGDFAIKDGVKVWTYLIQGVLEVFDKDAFMAKVVNGIGDGRCYGFGMVDLWA